MNETKIFPNERAMKKWLVELGLNVVYCCNCAIVIKQGEDVLFMNYKLLGDGGVELL